MTEPAPQAPAPQPAAPFTEAEDKQYATLATFLNIIVLIPALVFYFAFRGRGPKISEQSKENLNWSLNVTGALIISWILAVALTFVFIGVLFWLIYFAVLIVNLIFSILGGVKVSNTGELYRYPFAIRFIK